MALKKWRVKRNGSFRYRFVRAGWDVFYMDEEDVNKSGLRHILDELPFDLVPKRQKKPKPATRAMKGPKRCTAFVAPEEAK